MKKLTSILILAATLVFSASAQYVSFNEPTNATEVGVISYAAFLGDTASAPTPGLPPIATVAPNPDRATNSFSPCMGVWCVSNSIAIPATVPSGKYIFLCSVSALNGTSAPTTNGCSLPVQWLFTPPPPKPLPPTDLMQH